jgi:ABC-type branched-subunit amino acid transport system substrate-binding protein
VIVTQVFPNERSISYPMVKEALALAQAKGQVELSPAALEGFASAKVLVEALRRAGPNPTREGLYKALAGMTQYDAGGYVVNFGDSRHGTHYVELAVISRGGQFRF